MRKEQVVFVVTALALAWLVWGRLEDDATRSRRVRSADLELQRYPAPDVSLSLPDPERSQDFRRDLFIPPRDTTPLPPLALEPPPLEPLPAVAPPAAYGPSLEHAGRWLRREVTSAEVPGLFEVAEEGEPLGLDPGMEGPAMEIEGGAGGLGGTFAGVEPASPEERAERIAGYRKLYDWIRVGNLKFGRIVGDDRYALPARPDEPVEFVEVDPETGRERFEGQAPIVYERERVTELGFADTPANRIELARREFGDELRPGQLEEALAFAEECVRSRLEAPRALEVAEEMFRLAKAVADGDPRPDLGLARCFEAGFEFEKAYDLYRELLEKYDKDPLVHVRLAELYARFRLDEEAEAAFEEALRWGRTHWEVNWRFGRWLLGKGRGADAVSRLEQAGKFEPTSIETASERAAMRTDYGRALLHEGRVEEALELFERALVAGPTHFEALAGVLDAQRLLGHTDELVVPTAVAESGAGFDLALAFGMLALEHGEHQLGREQLQTAARMDPFRAHLAWRALSWLAERSGYPEEAASFIEAAYEVFPGDAWTLYQRGRLAAARDDLEGAEQNFRAALDVELDFADALAAMGEVLRRRGDHEATERYLARALSLEDGWALVQSLRGFNALQLGNDDLAERSFERALELAPELASARSGLAWCRYVGGDSQEATTLFADLVERRRHEPEDDPYRVYAETQIARILDHEQKEIWRDGFDRRDGTRLMKGWLSEQPHGLEVSLQDGALFVDGQMTSAGTTRVYQDIPLSQFVSFQATLTIGPETRARVGIFLSREMRRRGEWEVQAALRLGRDKEGAVQVQHVQQGERDAPWEDLFTTGWELGRAMPVRVERSGEGSDTRLSLWVDGLPVLEGLRAPRIGSSSADLRFGVFVEGDSGRSAGVRIDDVEVVRRVHP